MTLITNARAAAAALLLAAPALLAADAPQPLSGIWSATADVGGAAIPFRLELSGEGKAVGGHFFDGARPTNPASGGTFDGEHLHLTFPSYAAVIDATVHDGRLDGTYATPSRTTVIHAVRGVPAAVASGAAPAIAGEWIVPFDSEKGEKAWRLIVRQTGPTAQAAILRIDGDTGTLDGAWDGGAFRLSHFAGERPALLTITPAADHTLGLVLNDGSGRHALTAVRPADAAKAGLAPSDPTHTAGVTNRAQPFRFAFKDLDGRLVTNADARFHHKVVVVDVMGSWCPNCHDEAPFLQTLYAKHHKDGLEVVALDFEQTPGQLADPSRLRAFVARYGLTYTVLLAGLTHDVHDKLPQATHLDAWPTTFFIGRDGRVAGTHVGFTSPGSGPRDLATRRDVERRIDALLAAKA